MKTFKSTCVILIMTLVLNIVGISVAYAAGIENKGVTNSAPQNETNSMIPTDKEGPVFPSTRYVTIYAGGEYLSAVDSGAYDDITQFYNFLSANTYRMAGIRVEGSSIFNYVKAYGNSKEFNPDASSNWCGYGKINDYYRVADLQRSLNYRMSAGLAVDGSYGPATNNAVITFQRSWGLVADGSVGPATWRKICTGNK